MGLFEACVFDNGKRCSILIKKACGNCNFEKSKKEYEESKAKAAERIKSLPSSVQAHIKATYRIAEQSPLMAEVDQ